MRAKDVAFEVTYINLREKPDWFLEISPHGKVPVLLVDEVPLFESNAIAEYLEEMVEPHLHPADPIKRARNRAWTDFVSDFSRALNGVTYSKSKADMEAGIEGVATPLSRIEEAIEKERDNDGPYFNGAELCLVDAAYAPFLLRFSIAERVLQTGLLKRYPRVQAWSEALLSTEIITGAVAPSFPEEFDANLKRRGTYAWSLMEAAQAAE